MSKIAVITGASGLLGRSVYQEFLSRPDWHVVGLAFSRAKGKLRQIDIRNPSEIHSLMDEVRVSIYSRK